MTRASATRPSTTTSSSRGTGPTSTASSRWRWRPTRRRRCSGGTGPRRPRTSRASRRRSPPRARSRAARCRPGCGPALRARSANPGSPASLPTTQTIDGILALSSFEDFTSPLQGQHDFVHGWTGGDMGVVATSAFDPIFWSHHCMIDRLCGTCGRSNTGSTTSRRATSTVRWRRGP
ncbi:MAG: tyrosinase family protein [Solirubrobacteraceae bacterium]